MVNYFHFLLPLLEMVNGLIQDVWFVDAEVEQKKNVENFSRARWASKTRF
jgi:hypothetical protein